MKHTDDGDDWYAIHSVHYDDNGKVAGWTRMQTTDVGVSVCDPRGSSVEELKRDLELMILAITKPVLDYETGLEV